MKTILLAATTIAIFLLLNCNKHSNPPAPINCDGLITDTAGTNDSGRVYMPNAFSPNGDGANDFCMPFTVNIASINFTVYDAENNVVFTTNQLNQAWRTSSITVNTKFYYKIQAVTTANHKIGDCGEVYALFCFPKDKPSNYFYFANQYILSGFDKKKPTGEPGIMCP